MIEFIDVEKTYKKSGVDALKGISFRIEDGEFVFIIGKSGSGKSTLMKCITAEEKPTSGQVLIDDFDIAHMSRALIPVLRRNIGMVYQDFRLIESKTVRENISFAGEIIGVNPKSMNSSVQLVLNMVGLKEKADSYPEELSGGEQQRVAIARAMLNNPQLIVADEPTGNLDPETSENIMALLQQINNSGTTVLVCTHDSNLVDKMKKRVIEISDGLIRRDEKDSQYRQIRRDIPEVISMNSKEAGVTYGDEESDGQEETPKAIENTPGFCFGDEEKPVIPAENEAAVDSLFEEKADVQEKPIEQPALEPELEVPSSSESAQNEETAEDKKEENNKEENNKEDSDDWIKSMNLDEFDIDLDISEDDE